MAKRRALSVKTSNAVTLALLAYAALLAHGCSEEDNTVQRPDSGTTHEGVLGGDGAVLPDSAGPGQQNGAADAAAEQDAAAPVITGDVTYYQRVKPVIDAKCVRCHVAGTVAPFALDTYALAKQYAALSRAAINSGIMPPWKFADGCNDYKGNFSLSAEEKALFGAWVDQGTPEGDASKPAPKLDIGEQGLSRVDVTLKMPEPYTSQQEPDEYRCFPVRWPAQYTSDTFMTGFKAVPGNARVVHHVEVYYVPKAQAQQALDKDTADPGPGYKCFGGPGLGDGTVGGWAPGSPGYDYPAGVGIRVQAGSVMVIQVHYNTQTAGKAEADQTSVQFKVDAQATPGGYDFWTNPTWASKGLGGMPIPANNPDVAHNWIADPTTLNGGGPFGGGKAITIHMAALHMHNLGTTGFMYLKRKDGTRQCVLKIDDWDFHWQGGVMLKEPLKVQPGETIELECRYDNSAKNQPSYQGKQQTPRDVNWGENTTDEMCLGILLWGP